MVAKKKSSKKAAKKKVASKAASQPAIAGAAEAVQAAEAEYLKALAAHHKACADAGCMPSFGSGTEPHHSVFSTPPHFYSFYPVHVGPFIRREPLGVDLDGTGSVCYFFPVFDFPPAP